MPVRRKVGLWQDLRAGQLAAELECQVLTHKGLPSSISSSAKSLDPW